MTEILTQKRNPPAANGGDLGFDADFKLAFEKLDSDDYDIREQGQNELADLAVRAIKNGNSGDWFRERISESISSKIREQGKISPEQKYRAQIASDTMFEGIGRVLSKQLGAEVSLEKSELSELRTPKLEKSDLENARNLKIADLLSSLDESLKKFSIASEIYQKLEPSRNDFLGEALASSKFLTKDLDGSLARDENVEVRTLLARNPKLSEASQVLLLGDKSDRVREAVYQRKDLAPLTVEKMVEGDDFFARVALASRKDLTPELALRLLSHRERNVSEALAENPHAPAEVIERLSHRGAEIEKVAAHPALSVSRAREMLADLEQRFKSGQVDIGLFRGLAKNQKLSKQDMQRLFELGESNNPEFPKKDYSYELGRLGYQRHVSPKLLEILASNPRPEFRTQAASHQNTPSSVLTMLAEDKEDAVRARVVYNSAAGTELRAKIFSRLRADDRLTPTALARSPDADPEHLKHLSSHKSPVVRAAVAKHPLTAPSIRAFLVNDSDPLVSEAAVNSPATSEGLLEEVEKQRLDTER